MEPLFTADGPHWMPQPYTRGPFDGLQGGAVAALLCAVAERNLPAGYATISIDARYLRPTPLAALTVSARLLHAGGRVAIVEAGLWADDKPRAVATITAMRHQRIETIPEPLRHERGWETASPRKPTATLHGKPWLMDRMEARVAAGGQLWFQFEDAVIGDESGFARALCPIDWLPGVTRPDSWEAPLVAAAPNIDLSVRALRLPIGPWYGIEASGLWSRDGHGLAYGALLDAEGVAAAISCSVALVPHAPSGARPDGSS
jgi:hypothetical protein